MCAVIVRTGSELQRVGRAWRTKLVRWSSRTRCGSIGRDGGARSCAEQWTRDVIGERQAKGDERDDEPGGSCLGGLGQGVVLAHPP